jgi:putative intracellular protease/amidase
MLVTQVYKVGKFVTACAGVAVLIAAGPLLNAFGIIGG